MGERNEELEISRARFSVKSLYWESSYSLFPFNSRSLFLLTIRAEKAETVPDARRHTLW